MGPDRGPLPAPGDDRPAPAPPAPDRRRRPLGPGDRRPLARPARGVRPLGHRLGPLRQVELRRDPGPDPLEAPLGPRRRRGDRRRVVVRRRDGGPGREVRRRGRKKGDPEEPEDHALGRSRGGYSTKIHILCDGHGHPLHFHLTAGQAHETTAFIPLLVGADEHITDGEGSPVAWPVAMAGDKGYRADWIDEYLLNLGITPVIPSK